MGGGLRGVRLGRWIKIGWPRLYDGALMGDPFLLEEPFMGFSFSCSRNHLSAIRRDLDRVKAGSNGDGSKRFPDSNPRCMGRDFGAPGHSSSSAVSESSLHFQMEKRPLNWACRENPDVQPKTMLVPTFPTEQALSSTVHLSHGELSQARTEACA